MFLVNEPQLRIISDIDKKLVNQNNIGNAKSSHHYPMRKAMLSHYIKREQVISPKQRWSSVARENYKKLQQKRSLETPQTTKTGF